MHTSVPLSRLVASRRNPRRVKPEREAHRRLVASIRAHGLLEPLVVRPADEDRYMVIAGNRRLAALRDVHRGQNPDISCEVRDVDHDTADAMSLSENFTREGMHPLDEAEAFAKLASVECKGVTAIAVEFGVTAHYVRQRMKLATLADTIKAAYRENRIDTAAAEAFAVVPVEKQHEVWGEINQNPQHIQNPRLAQHVRNVIAHGWIDAGHALFDVTQLPDAAVSRDLFSEQVLVERHAFMEAQAEALIRERERLIEDGWGEVIVAARTDVQDRLYAMDPVEGDVDEATATRLAELDAERTRLEEQLDALDDDENDAAVETISERLDELDRQAQALAEAAPRHYAEATKATATVFLLADPDGKVRQERRVPRSHRRHASHADGGAATGLPPQAPPPLTPDNLSDRQNGTTFTHEAWGVREALLHNAAARRRMLVLILHEHVRAEGLAVRHDTNDTDVFTTQEEGFASAIADGMLSRRTEFDPFVVERSLDGVEAYQRLRDIPDAQLDALIELLTVGFVTARLHRPTPLVRLLAAELGVNVRRCWRPDAAWLGSYKKVQLAHLIGELRGPVHGSAAERLKKSELVDHLTRLFADAAEGRLDDPQLAARVNAWLPANVRPEPEASADAEGDPATPQAAA